MSDARSRIVPAVHGRTSVNPDPPHEIAFADALRRQHGPEALKAIAQKFSDGEGEFEVLMRRVLWRAMTRGFGDGVRVGRGIVATHPETFTVGSGVFLGDHAILQGRFDGRCTIGDYTWIGPQSYFDARDLAIGSHVGWGPGARVLGSMHVGEPADVPIIETDLEIKPVRIGDWADIGVNAVILPGVTIGKGAIVGAGAVVTTDVEPFSIVAGVPAKFVRLRQDTARGRG